MDKHLNIKVIFKVECDYFMDFEIYITQYNNIFIMSDIFEERNIGINWA